jgi:hypothetical protein
MDTPVAGVFSPQIYGNYPVLDSILLHYLDIESIIQRHEVNPTAFETQESLYFLAQRFDLPPSTSFPAFIDRYDNKYATVRSYLLPGAKPKAIMLKAARAGELQAFYLGLRLNLEYKTPTLLDRALKLASRGDHPVMIDLIKDLGGTSASEELRGTAQGGHLEKLKRLIAQGPDLSRFFIFQLTKGAVKFGQLDTVKYLITFWMPVSIDLKYLSRSAGRSGNQGVIDYITSQGGINYSELIIGAITGAHLELAMRYMDKPGLNYSDIFSSAVDFNYLDLAKLVARDHRIDRYLLNDLMSCVSEITTYETIEYLIFLGGNKYTDLVIQLAIYDYIELFKRYYLSPGVDYVQVFNRGLENSSVEIVKFMLEQHLVPETVEELNEYLRLVALTPELIELLFSLGGTDYRTIVERGLIYSDLALAVKYFDRAPGLRRNKIFKLCTKIAVYRYLLSRGPIKQKTVDTTLSLLEQSNDYVEAKKYLRSLNLQDGGSTSH